MSAYKQFTTKDITVTAFNVTREFLFSGNAVTGSNVGIDFYTGINPTSSLFISSSVPQTGFVYTENTTGVYNNIKQLYYTNYLNLPTGDLVPTSSLIPGVTREDDRLGDNPRGPRFDNYLQTSKSQSRFFPTQSGAEISVISIPSKLYGNQIVPNSFKYTINLNGTNFTVTDDGEGNLIESSNIIGQIFYPHGIAAITSGSLTGSSDFLQFNPPTTSSDNLYGVARYGVDTYGVELNSVSIGFSSSFQIFETQYKAEIEANDFQFSLNPSISSGSNYQGFTTASYFNPYITTVGLYNNSQELVAVGKLSTPLQASRFTDTTIVVNLDR